MKLSVFFRTAHLSVLMYLLMYVCISMSVSMREHNGMSLHAPTIAERRRELQHGRKKAYIISLKNQSIENNGMKQMKHCEKIKLCKEYNFTDINKNKKVINVAIFGSTGSIGINTLNIIRECNKTEKRFNVEALYVNKNVHKLYEQVQEFLPRYVCIHDETKYEEIKMLLQNVRNYNPIILMGNEGMKEICKNSTIDKIVIGIDSFQGLYSTIYAIKNNKIIALANKESIVSAGFFLKKLLTVHKNSTIIPVDSEHSAIFQCLDNNKVLKTKCLQDGFCKVNEINKIFLCSSGGPFQNFSLDCLKNVTSQDALKHPKWKMGQKITIDSATMMNKGLEVIEAHFLFDVNYENIEIVVHKECIIHSCVEFVDKSVISQMYYPDMKIPILYALTWPNRIKTDLPSLNLANVSPLTFHKPSLDHFPCIKLAYTAGKKGNFYPTVLNAANEVANNFFLKNMIGYFDISTIISSVLESFNPQKVEENCEDLMKQILDIHNWSRSKAIDVYSKMGK
ncbi:1-deoxy-D-xylulose 5-phosphate reductoisomerase [Plasmodium gonderi]|uniref:1-deoxy-D-xylulose 5-phosphate reductoisomerase, apicoplastic n=1 Tax=Plasmodium gonderi TaxID=77519 RepID=A0A1Y1JNK7_PLAGO|nr:1-deoxy-D-xylulose 5-phosphate reductoisomerase [Plasmodium gonderi]GAW82412.1 1-deoxy-D-xylulose 5-phosphate reductoisomerase [Plasmodium gonderi]